jgi:ParB-like nuclease family protein/DNA methylase
VVRRRMDQSVGEVTPLSIVYRNIDELTPLPNNARKHSKKQIKQIANSIEAFGFCVPFLIDGNLRLIAGHGRLAACQVLGIRQVPTIRLEHLDESQMRAFTIAENRIAENATWNRPILAEHMKALSEINLDFNLETTGFEMKEIDLMVAGLTPSAVDRDHSDEVLANAEIRNPVSRSGDLWRLGDHCLVCGDPSEARNYSSLLTSATRAGTLITTIPTPESTTPLSETAGDRFLESLCNTFRHFVEFSEPSALQFISADWHCTKLVLMAAESAGLALSDICAEVQESGRRGCLLQSQQKMTFVFEVGGDKRLGSRLETWRHRDMRLRTKKASPKPTSINTSLAVITELILDCTATGEILLAPFLGAGNTLIAAERTGRVCYGIELDPLQVDETVRRWQGITGNEATHDQQGGSFGAMAKGRDE